MNIFETSKEYFYKALARENIIIDDEDDAQKELKYMHDLLFIYGYHSSITELTNPLIADEIMQLIKTCKLITRMMIPQIAVIMDKILYHSLSLDEDTLRFVRIFTNAYRSGISYRLTPRPISSN